MRFYPIKIVIVFIILFFGVRVYAIGIEEVQCKGEEYIVISGVSISDVCSIVDSANNSRSDDQLVKSQSGSFVKISWGTYKFLNDSGQEWFKISCGESSAEMSYENGDCEVGSDASSGDNSAQSDQSFSDSSSGDQTTKAKKEVPVYYKNTMYIPQILFSGIEYEFGVDIRRGGGSYPKERGITSGYFVWNFGDGAYIEYDGNESPRHIYSNPGQYVINFEYYNNFFSFQDKTDPTLSWRGIVDVLPTALQIESIDYSGGIVIRNNSSKEIDLDNWAIKYNENLFIFDHKTILLPENKITIPNSSTHLNIPHNATDVFLYTSEMKVASAYYGSKYIFSGNSDQIKPATEEKEETPIILGEETTQDYKKYTATASNSGNNSDRFLWMLIAGVSILATLIVLIRGNMRNKTEDSV